MKKDRILKWMARFFVMSWILVHSLIFLRTSSLLAAMGIMVGFGILPLMEEK